MNNFLINCGLKEAVEGFSEHATELPQIVELNGGERSGGELRCVELHGLEPVTAAESSNETDGVAGTVDPNYLQTTGANQSFVGMPTESNAFCMENSKNSIENQANEQSDGKFDIHKFAKASATVCVTTKFNNTSVADVDEFMGYAENVHRNYYRRNNIDRQTVQMSEVLEAVSRNFGVHCNEEVADAVQKRKMQSPDLEVNKKPRRACAQKPQNKK